MDLISIDSGDEGVRFMAKVMAAMSDQESTYVDFDGIEKDDAHPDWDKVKNFYLTMRRREAEEFDVKSIVSQWKDAVENAVSNATGIVLALMRASGMRIERTLVGDIKKRINGRKKAACGAVMPTVESYKDHYKWTQALAKDMRTTKQVPSWLK
jgi:hypothetical protein